MANESKIHLPISYKFPYSTNPENGKYDRSYFEELEKFIVDISKSHNSNRVTIVEDWAETSTKADNMYYIIKKLGLKPDIIVLSSVGESKRHTIISPNNDQLVKEIRSKFTRHARVYVTDGKYI